MEKNSAETHTYGPDGIDGSAVGRTMGLTSLVLGIGGLLLSAFLIGVIPGIAAVVLGVIAIVKSMGAKRRVAEAGRQPNTAGAFGLGLIGIITGVAGIAIASAIYYVAATAVGTCDGRDLSPEQYQKCLQEEAGLAK